MGERGGRERRGKARWKAPEKQKRFLRSRVKEALITHETGEEGIGVRDARYGTREAIESVSFITHEEGVGAMDGEMEGGGEAREEVRGGRD